MSQKTLTDIISKAYTKRAQEHTSSCAFVILFYLLLQAVEIFRVKKFGKCDIKTVAYLFYR